MAVTPLHSASSVMMLGSRKRTGTMRKRRWRGWPETAWSMLSVALFHQLVRP